MVVIVIDSHGSETTDTLIPFGVLAASGLVDVSIIADTTDPVPLFPALTIRPQATLADFDAMHPDGADYVIVPASHRLEASPLIQWIANQADKEATIIGVCAGAKSLAAAGLLKSRRATTHWYELAHLQRLEPDMIHVPNMRYVADGRIITTTGVSASLPVSLALIEAIAGPIVASQLADVLGVKDWSTEHDSSPFWLTTGAFLTGLGNRLSFRKRLGVPVDHGVSEIALAFTADAWSRTYRSQAFAVSPLANVATRHGLSLIPARHHMDGLWTNPYQTISTGNPTPT